MYRIAICDNDEQIIKEISEILNRVAKNYDAQIQLYNFSNGRDILNSHVRFNLIFLDIQLDGINGFKLAKRIRKIDAKVQIVYVTKNLDYLKEAYKLHVFDYIEKPYKPEDIRRVFVDYLKFINFIERDVIYLTLLNNRELMLPVEKIIYISCGVKKREVIIITKDRDYMCKGVISEIYSELNNFDFFMPHRSHIINLAEVKSYIKNEKIFMNNDDEIPLSKGHTKEFEKIFERKMEELT